MFILNVDNARGSSAWLGDTFSTRAGSRYFCESFYGHPCPTSGKNHATAMPAAAPDVLLLSLGTQQGVPSIILAMTRRDFGKPAFSLRKKTLRENTCTIASGDYSTPVSQRRNLFFLICFVISQFFPGFAQAELLDYRQAFNVVSDSGIMSYKGFIGKSESGAFIGLNQSVEFWSETIGDSFPSFVECSSLRQAQPKQIANTTSDNNRQNPDQWVSDDADKIHAMILGFVMGLPITLWLIFYEPNVTVRGAPFTEV